MEFVKKINNNVALVKDKKAVEWIIIGKGIGFGKKRGDQIAADEVDRRFLSEPDTHQLQLLDSIENIDQSVLQTSAEVCDIIYQEFSITLTPSHYIALADHLHYALKRIKDGTDYHETSLWEVSKLYPTEYKAAIRAMQHINESLGVRLPQSEELYITYHFVNASSKKGLENDMNAVSRIMKKIIDIIAYSGQIQMDIEDVAYARFIVHVRYFVMRQLNREQLNVGEVDMMLLDIVKEKYHVAYEVARKAISYLETREGWKVSEAEVVYLILHIQRLIDTKNEY